MISRSPHIPPRTRKGRGFLGVSIDDFDKNRTGTILEACAAQYQSVSLTFVQGVWTLHLLGKGGDVILRDHDLDRMLERALP